MSVGLGEFVGVQILSSGFSTANKIQMVDPKRQWVRRCRSTIDNHGKWYAQNINGSPEGEMLLLCVEHDVSQAGTNQIKTDQCTPANKSEEITVVAAANTIVEPNTVMIKSLDTVVTDSAVVAARWSPNITGLAILDRHIHGS